MSISQTDRQTYQKYSSEPYNKLKQTKLIKDENKIKTNKINKR